MNSDDVCWFLHKNVRHRLILFSTSDDYKGELEIPIWWSAFGFVEELCSSSKLSKLFDNDSQPSISFQLLSEYIKRILSKNPQDFLKSALHTKRETPNFSQQNRQISISRTEIHRDSAIQRCLSQTSIPLRQRLWGLRQVFQGPPLPRRSTTLLLHDFTGLDK